MSETAVTTELPPTLSRSHLACSEIRLRLRQETAAVHAALEQGLNLLGADPTIERYRRVLKAFHGFYAPLEARVAPVALPPFPLARRTQLPERDLAASGVPPHEVAALPQCADLPPLDRPEHLAGCLYVPEGAALGGQIIGRELDRRVGIARNSRAAFFVGEGAGSAARWTRVLAWLDEVACAGERGDEVVAAAVETFRALARWAHAQGVLR